MRNSNVSTITDTRCSVLRTWRQALRVHQWAKNLIILVPVITAHRITDGQVVLKAVLGVILFNLAASGVYIINDILDLDADRQHPMKRDRPFASGELPVRVGLFASLILFLAALAGALILPSTFLVVLCAYLLITTFYSTILKRWLMADVVCLALLYLLRVIAGHAATELEYSTWLLAFALFFFFSLAMLKRFSELLLLRSAGRDCAQGRGYLSCDLESVAMLGVSNGSVAVLVLVLYVASEEVRILYQHPEILLLMAPVMLYWLGRLWTLAYRGRVHEDPVIFGMHDKVSYVAGAISLAIMTAATF